MEKQDEKLTTEGVSVKEAQTEELTTGKIIFNDITARDILKLGRQILTVIAVLFILAAISELLIPNNTVFEVCKTILPSIATLVIGYYFGSSSQ